MRVLWLVKIGEVLLDKVGSGLVRPCTGNEPLLSSGAVHCIDGGSHGNHSVLARQAWRQLLEQVTLEYL